MLAATSKIYTALYIYNSLEPTLTLCEQAFSIHKLVFRGKGAVFRGKNFQTLETYTILCETVFRGKGAVFRGKNFQTLETYTILCETVFRGKGAVFRGKEPCSGVRILKFEIYTIFPETVFRGKSTS